MTEFKPYEPALKDAYDSSAKKVCSEFLISTGLFTLDVAAEDQPEEYKKRDFLIKVKETNRPLNIECEVKAVWTKVAEWQNTLWPVHIPFRKAGSKADLFFMLNKSLNTLCMITSTVLHSSPVVSKNTTNQLTGTTTKSEQFFEIPLSKINFYFKNVAGEWVEILTYK